MMFLCSEELSNEQFSKIWKSEVKEVNSGHQAKTKAQSTFFQIKMKQDLYRLCNYKLIWKKQQK